MLTLGEQGYTVWGSNIVFRFLSKLPPLRQEDKRPLEEGLSNEREARRSWKRWNVVKAAARDKGVGQTMWRPYTPSSATSGDDDDDDKLKEDSLREAPSHSNGRKGMDTRGLKEEDQPVIKTVIISNFKWAIKIIDVV